MHSIRCDGLSKSFGGVRALANFCFEFPASGVVAVIGPNGAGKTTLINVLSGFIRADSGHCFIGGNETTHLPPHRIARLGVARTFQDLRLIFQLSSLENVLLARQGQRGEHLLNALLRFGVSSEESQNRHAAIRLLDYVGIGGQASSLAGELSYGQQKLLSLACCLAQEAQILLLDEPASGVHPEMVSHILTLLESSKKLGKLIIFIEHDISAVRQVADLVVVMHGGKNIAHGPPDEILERPEIMETYLA